MSHTPFPHISEFNCMVKKGARVARLSKGGPTTASRVLANINRWVINVGFPFPVGPVEVQFFEYPVEGHEPSQFRILEPWMLFNTHSLAAAGKGSISAFARLHNTHGSDYNHILRTSVSLP